MSEGGEPGFGARHAIPGGAQFYRDPEAIALLRREVIEPLVVERRDKEIRAWVVGCATGQEAYTIGIELSEAMEKLGSDQEFRIIATDVHRQSIDIASAGTYPADATQGVPAHLRDKYFTSDGTRDTVAPGLRQRIIFSVHDARSDPPFLDLDLISCRNLLTSLKETAQAQVVSMFAFGLRDGGALLLGPSETLGHHEEAFEVIDARWRLFRKSPGRPAFAPVAPPPLGRWGNETTNNRAEPNLPLSPELRDFADLRGRQALMRAQDILLARYVPPSFLVTTDCEVLAWYGSAGAFIDTPSGVSERSVDHILHPDLRFIINDALDKLRTEDLPSFSRCARIDMGEAGPVAVTLTFEPLDRGSRPGLVLIRVQGNAEPPSPSAGHDFLRHRR